MNTKKVKTWKARPAVRTWFATVGSVWLLSAVPMDAAPVICTTVATTSLKINPTRIAVGRRAECCGPTALIRKVRIV